jgi:2-haloacid dehalogenase
MDRVIVFDVNETLLDISALRPQFERVFGDGAVLPAWFQQVLQYSLAVTLAGLYFDFSEIGAAALAMVAEARGISLAESDKQAIVQGMLTLPPHADAAPSLKRLKEAGFRLATLTNSSQTAASKQLKNAGLDSFFEKSISVDSVRRYKPAPEAYRMAAGELGVSIEKIRLVAAHAWTCWEPCRRAARLRSLRGKTRFCSRSREGPTSWDRIFRPFAKRFS